MYTYIYIYLYLFSLRSAVQASGKKFFIYFHFDLLFTHLCIREHVAGSIVPERSRILDRDFGFTTTTALDDMTTEARTVGHHYGT